ncbi:MAG TPA: multidrug efflux RND transporter permease subunit [Patescibacteria group bacterium]|nr:multidrug efflux RND transporter permease subunit [Patescibacteria group bacterium]
MNFAKFFVDRPIFAGVLSLLVLLGGLVSMPLLPISEYPEVAPPSVVVRASYPGANPKVIAETVATPLEEQINGVEGMLYINSQSTADGQMGLTVTFKLGTDPDKAQQLVQNRVSQALPRLPDIVRQIGVNTVKSSNNITLVIHLTSPDGRYDTTYLRNFGALNIRDRMARLKGVGEVSMFGGGDYAMRIWLDPTKIAQLGLTANDVVNAIREQNVQVAGGVVGGQPHNSPTAFELLVNAQGRLQSEEQFRDIILKTSETGGITRLGEVARVELGPNQYAMGSLLNNKQAAAIAIFQAPESNAIQLSNDARAVMAELKKTFPEGIDYSIVYDPTRFVQASIDSVIHTLLEAIALVVLVVIVFLQTWRASIIPLLAVPVSVVGTFAVMHLFGFSINNLTLFGLVLSIGIVVDDAIVVVENVERNIEEGLPPLQAAHKAMEEVSGPIIAIALTLCAVFVPLAFITGLTGQFYRQFALTIAISTVISAFNSLTLSPALAAKLLHAHNAEGDAFERFLNRSLGWFFNGFNRAFKGAARGYSRGLKGAVRFKPLVIAVYLLLAGGAAGLLYFIPQGYIPLQDKQYLVAFAQLPSGASLERTEAVIRRMGDIAMAEPGVESAVAFPGLSIASFSASSSAGLIFITLDPFEERTSGTLYGPLIAGSLMGKMAQIEDAFIAVVPPPPVMGLGMIGGFKIQIEDRADLGFEALQQAVMATQMKAWQTPELANVFSSFQINVPQLYVDVNRDKAKQLGVSVTDIFNTMQIYLGSLYINDFNKFGRTYQVIAQADAPFRAQANDILQLKTRNMAGEMVPLGSLVDVKQSYGPDTATRYNLFRTADLNGGPAPGVPAEVAEQAMVNILKETLPPGMDFEWTDLKYQQILAGNTAIYIFPLCVLLVFLVLAAQYESLILPLVVIMIVPIVMLCGLFGVWVTGSDNNIFTQIGLIVLVGLACKNAILIVEFARELEFQGQSIIDAAMNASKLRLRPILMTSFAFIMGVLPLVSSTGAGAEMRHAIGITVFSGMLGVTLLGIFFTPVFYVLLRTLAGGVLTGHHHAGTIAVHAEAGK